MYMIGSKCVIAGQKCRGDLNVLLTKAAYEHVKKSAYLRFVDYSWLLPSCAGTLTYVAWVVAFYV